MTSERQNNRDTPQMRFGTALLTLVFLFLALSHLGAASLWDDEASVAIIAKNFLRTGELTAWDGRNLTVYSDGRSLNQRLITILSPLDYLFAAGSFRLLGQSDFTARLPFVLAGLLVLPYFFFYLKLEFPDQPEIRWYAFVFLALSVPFLLYVRNCRYYALSILFAQATYTHYRQFIIGRRWPAIIGAAAAFVLLFYSQFLLAVVFGAGVLVVLLIEDRHKLQKRHWLMLTASAVAALLAILPYAVAHKIWNQPDIQMAEAWFPYRPLMVLRMFGDLSFMGCLPWMVSVCLIAWIFRNRKAPGDPDKAAARRWMLLIGVYCVALGLLTPNPLDSPPINDARYISPLIPLGASQMGVAVCLLRRRSLVAAIVAVAVLLCTNFASLWPANPIFNPLASPWFPSPAIPRLTLPAYINEITHPYPTQNSAAASALESMSAQDDTVMVQPSFYSTPIQYYAGNKLRIACILDRASPLPKPLIDSLHAPLYIGSDVPLWIIAYGHGGNADPADESLFGGILTDRRFSGSRYILRLTMPEYWFQSQRPELPWHSFGPVHADPKHGAVYIFQKES